jgi:hypothetical protein
MVERIEADLRSGRRSVRQLTTVELDGLIGYLSGATPEVAHRRRRRSLQLMTIGCVGLVPWIALIATILPNHYEVVSWRLAWTGFDIGELVMLAMTAYLGWRGRLATLYSALATAVLLVCDAWFDITTSNRHSLLFALLDAAFVELPFAVLLIRGSLRMLRIQAGHLGLNGGHPMTLRQLWTAPLLVTPLEDGSPES